MLTSALAAAALTQPINSLSHHNYSQAQASLTGAPYIWQASSGGSG